MTTLVASPEATLRPYLYATEERRRPADPTLGANLWTIDSLLARLERAMVALGPTSAAVAERLTAMGITGERGNPDACPLARYLRRQRVGHFQVRVCSGGRVTVTGRDAWEDEIRIPMAVQLAQERFDRGEFPQLADATSKAYI